jgi:hypothetical protein
MDFLPFARDFNCYMKTFGGEQLAPQASKAARRQKGFHNGTQKA